METTYFLESENIYLREVRLSDVNENYYAWLNDPTVNQYLETRFLPRSTQNIEQYVESMDGNRDEIFFAICTKADDIYIGNIKVGPVNWIHRHADIGLLIGDKEYWGKGLATEAIRLISEFGFKKLNLHKLKAGCYADNVGSKKAFLKAGFVVEGTLRQQFFSNGAYQDAYQLGILKDEFDAQ